jgi:adenylate cyclase
MAHELPPVRGTFLVRGFAMTIRKKIFLLAGILLALFGVVVGVLATIQKLDSDQIGNVVRYELPLARLVAGFDVDTDRYELVVLRVLRLDPVTPADLKAALSAKQAATEELRTDVATAAALLDEAIQDPHYRTADRVDLARIDGSFKYLSRGLEEFLSVGDLTMRSLADGQREEARTASLSFASSRRPSVRISPRFATTLLISPIGRRAWCWRARGSTPI